MADDKSVSKDLAAEGRNHSFTVVSYDRDRKVMTVHFSQPYRYESGEHTRTISDLTLRKKNVAYLAGLAEGDTISVGKELHYSPKLLERFLQVYSRQFRKRTEKKLVVPQERTGSQNLEVLATDTEQDPDSTSGAKGFYESFVVDEKVEAKK